MLLRLTWSVLLALAMGSPAAAESAAPTAPAPFVLLDCGHDATGAPDEPEEEDPDDEELGDFEDEATKDKDRESRANGDSGELEEPNPFVLAFSGIITKIAVGLFAHGGKTSWYRVHGLPAPTGTDGRAAALEEALYPPRDPGELLIPFVSIAAGYQNVSSDVASTNTSLEGGYGPIAADFRWTHYMEDHPSSTLDLIQWHVLYRMSFSQRAEIDLGAGQIILDGEHTQTGFSFTTPITLQFGQYVGASFRPTWGVISENTISDMDLALLVHRSFLGLQLGYRWVHAGSAELDGPVLRISFQM